MRAVAAERWLSAVLGIAAGTRSVCQSLYVKVRRLFDRTVVQTVQGQISSVARGS